MTDNLQADLTRMLDQYDERRRADLAREKKGRDDDAAFIAAFAGLRRDVVRPVFETVGTMLAGRGHAVEISEREFAAGAAGSAAREAEISLRIAPAGMAEPLHADGHERSLSITTRHYNKMVWISVGKPLEAGGVAGAKGAYPLERVDRQLVEGEVVRLVAAVMG